MSEFEHRLKHDLEPVLQSRDPRERLSVYHDMPFAIFRYDPQEELELRRQMKMLKTRLEQKGKVVHRISLAECLDSAMEAERPLSEWFEVERDLGLPAMVDTIHSVLAHYHPLVELVAKRLPQDADSFRDIVFLWRTGALFPVYRTFSLLEQLKGHTQVPTILFYPGHLDGPAGLKFMGILEAEHNYRAKIF